MTFSRLLWGEGANVELREKRSELVTRVKGCLDNIIHGMNKMIVVLDNPRLSTISGVDTIHDKSLAIARAWPILVQEMVRSHMELNDTMESEASQLIQDCKLFIADNAAKINLCSAATEAILGIFSGFQIPGLMNAIPTDQVARCLQPLGEMLSQETFAQIGTNLSSAAECIANIASSKATALAFGALGAIVVVVVVDFALTKLVDHLEKRELEKEITRLRAILDELVPISESRRDALVVSAHIYRERMRSDRIAPQVSTNAAQVPIRYDRFQRRQMNNRNRHQISYTHTMRRQTGGFRGRTNRRH